MATPSLIRIYLVDDHALIRQALASLIGTQTNMTVCGAAATAEIAFDEIRKLKPDVAIIDLALGGNSGLELIKSIRALEPEVGIAVVSMYREDTHGMNALSAGARGYVMKNDPPERILEAIRVIHAGGIFASTELADSMLKNLHAHPRLHGVPGIDTLSERELEIVNLIGQGNTTAEMALKLHVSIKTIETFRAHVKQKLNLENSMQLVHFCICRAREQFSASDRPSVTERARSCGETSARSNTTRLTVERRGSGSRASKAGGDARKKKT